MTHVQHTEVGPTRGARGPAAEPGLGLVLVLAAGKPLAHALEAPHGPAVAGHAVAAVHAVAQLVQLHVGHLLHAADAVLHLLRQNNQ